MNAAYLDDIKQKHQTKIIFFIKKILIAVKGEGKKGNTILKPFFFLKQNILFSGSKTINIIPKVDKPLADEIFRTTLPTSPLIEAPASAFVVVLSGSYIFLKNIAIFCLL